MDVPSALIKRYLDRRKIEIAACTAQLENKNYEDLIRVGHQMKGNGTTFGFPDLSLLGQRLETAALDSNHAEMKIALSEISVWLDNKLS